MIWFVDPPGEFFDCNEDTVVYFDPQSGTTHLLSVFTAHLLQRLIDDPMSTDQLTAKISTEVDLQHLPDLDHSVAEILDELEALDIVSSA